MSGPESGAVDTSRSAIVSALNDGAALTYFFGHGGHRGTWSNSADMLNVTNIQSLTNTDKPTAMVVLDSNRADYTAEHWYSSLTGQALLAGDEGAATLIGPTTMLYAISAINMGTQMLTNLAQPGTTFGDGLQQAKDNLVTNPPYSNWLDISSDGYAALTILGDPTLVMTDDEPLSLPVTLSWTRAIASDDSSVEFRWQTATEVANAGFNIFAESEDGLYQLNVDLIPSKVIDSIAPTDYKITLETGATHFYIEEVSIEGKKKQIGPFEIDASNGINIDRVPGESRNKIYLPFVLGL